MRTTKKRHGTGTSQVSTPKTQKSQGTAPLQKMANNSPQVQEAAQFKAMANNSAQVQEAAQLKEMAGGAEVVQRARQHVENYGCETYEAVGANFQGHMANRVDDPQEFSANRGAVPNSIIHITDQQLAEEVAAELHTWPEDWNPYDQIWITSRGAYQVDEYYDGAYQGTYNDSIRIRCQLVDRGDGTQYYEVYHFGNPPRF